MGRGDVQQKRYVANQENINRFSGSKQINTWLDVPYQAFDNFTAPECLRHRSTSSYSPLPTDIPNIRSLTGPVALRSLWNLDPRWQTDRENHIVFVDQNFHKLWPMNANRWTFIKYWSRACGATLVKDTMQQLNKACSNADVIRKEYPACNSWPGIVEDRQWLYPRPDKKFASFSQFFKQVSKDLIVVANP